MAAAENRVVMRAVFRELLRLGRELDRNPLGKAFLLRQPQVIYDPDQQEVLQVAEEDSKLAREVTAWIRDFNRGDFYAPGRSAFETLRSLRQGLEFEGEDAVGLGFEAIRCLSAAVSAGDALASCRRPEEASLAFDAVSLRPAKESIRPGTILVSHPMSTIMHPVLHQSVIVITVVNEDSVFGVVVNRPAGSRLMDAFDTRTEELEPLSSRNFFLGGEIGSKVITALYEHKSGDSRMPEMDDMVVVAPDLRMTADLDALAEAARQGVPAAAGAKIIHGYVGWDRSQLMMEVNQNVWFVAEAEEDKPEIAPFAMFGADQRGDDGAPLGPLHQDAMWSAAMMHLARYEPEFECLANVRCADIQDFTAAEGAHFVTHDDSDEHEEGIIVAYHVPPHNPDDDDF